MTLNDAESEIAKWGKFDAQCDAIGEIEMTPEEYDDLRARVAQMGTGSPSAPVSTEGKAG